jgi:hypothetical protein
MNPTVKALFALLRFSLHGQRETPVWHKRVKWERLFALAARHGVVMLSYPAIQHLEAESQPPRKLKLRWVANVVKGSERALHYRRVVSDLSHLLSLNGLDAIVLKGLALARLYPEPSYREGGDIDIYMFDDAQRVDTIVASMGITVQHKTAKHSAFQFEGVTVENHRTLFDTGSRFEREGALYRKMEEMLAGMFTREAARELPPQAAALFLVGHTFRHFCCADINARHLCDWTVFFEKTPLDYDLLGCQISELGLDRFVTAMNAFCAENLGFSPPLLVGGREKGSRRLIARMIARYRRPRRIHIPIIGSVGRIFFRNRLYNRFLKKIAPTEFLLPELGRYFAWLATRLRRQAT